MASKVVIVTTSENITGDNYEYLDIKYLEKFGAFYYSKPNKMNDQKYINAIKLREKDIYKKRPFIYFLFSEYLIILCKDSKMNIDCFLDRLITTYSKKENNSAQIEFNPDKTDISFILHYTNDVTDIKDTKPERLMIYDLHTYKEKFNSNLYRDFNISNSRILVFSHTGNFIHSWILSVKNEVENKVFLEEIEKIRLGHMDILIDSMKKGDFISVYQNIQQ